MMGSQPDEPEFDVNVKLTGLRQDHPFVRTSAGIVDFEADRVREFQSP